jgi:hypothetical protein
MLDAIVWAWVGALCGVAGSTIVHKIQGLKKVPVEVEEKELVMAKGLDHNTTPQMRIGFIDAMNGRILEVSTQIPHPGVSNHYDWKTEMYVVPEDQKLSEAISTVMLMKGLDR